jgi:hypothetical protein
MAASLGVSEWSIVSLLVSCEIGNSKRGREAVNKEVDGSAALEAVTRQPVKTQQTGKT